jgi:hypothetical protein
MKMFSIIKFCENKCNPVEYNKLQTANNNPKMSTRMRYSQYIRTKKPNHCCNTNVVNMNNP